MAGQDRKNYDLEQHYSASAPLNSNLGLEARVWARLLRVVRETQLMPAEHFHPATNNPTPKHSSACGIVLVDMPANFKH